MRAWPLAYSSPSFSIGVSQCHVFVYLPRGRPREVVSMRLLQASEGEVRPGEVVSTRSSGGFLADAGSGRLI